MVAKLLYLGEPVHRRQGFENTSSIIAPEFHTSKLMALELNLHQPHGFNAMNIINTNSEQGGSAINVNEGIQDIDLKYSLSPVIEKVENARLDLTHNISTFLGSKQRIKEDPNEGAESSDIDLKDEMNKNQAKLERKIDEVIEKKLLL